MYLRVGFEGVHVQVSYCSLQGTTRRACSCSARESCSWCVHLHGVGKVVSIGYFSLPPSIPPLLPSSPPPSLLPSLPPSLSPSLLPSLPSQLKVLLACESPPAISPVTTRAGRKRKREQERPEEEGRPSHGLLDVPMVTGLLSDVLHNFITKKWVYKNIVQC